MRWSPLPFALFVGVIALMPAGCGSPGPGYGPSAGAQTRSLYSRYDAATEEKVLFAFDGPHGEFPTSGLTQFNASGPFYGTTRTGGAHDTGAVYRVTSRGRERVLHNFSSGKDSFSPSGALVQFGNEFYGAGFSNLSCRGRRSTCAGVIYAIDSSGRERLIYAFKGGSDGGQPNGSLAELNGAFYGTTRFGGKYGQGTVFEISPSGSERVLHSFVKPSGLQPTGGLIVVNRTLYGTTTAGGKSSDGTVFSITPSGKERVLHSFAGAPDGAFPAAGLTEVNGVLYGTTTGGGGGEYGYCFLSRGDSGCGTVFSIDTSGKERVLYSFNGPPDGASPSSSLIDVDGTLYGSTVYGGSRSCTRDGYCGTIFSLDASGVERIVIVLASRRTAHSRTEVLHTPMELYSGRRRRAARPPAETLPDAERYLRFR